jgi:hypothetical protein
MLAGKKTYIVGFLIAVVTFVHQMGWIEPGVYQTIMGLLGAGGLAALRAGVNKGGK